MTNRENGGAGRRGGNLLAAGSLVIPVLLASLGGYLAALLGLPLAWLVGAAVVSLLLNLSGFSVAMPALLYRASLVVVGTGIGLSVTVDMVGRIGGVAYLIPAAALSSIAIGRLLVPVFRRLSGLDGTTAYFSLVPAGLAEMAEISARHGADVGAVASMHALRVMLIVMILPAVIVHFVDADLPPVEAVHGVWDTSLLIALATGLISGWLASKVGVPNPYMLAPIVVLLVLSGAGLIEAREPFLLTAAAQVAIGLNLGACFRRNTMEKLPRAFAAAVPVMLLHATLMAGLAAIASRFSGMDLPTAILSFATGGTVEMVLTAKSVGSDVALVTVFQAARGIFGNALAGLIHAKTLAPKQSAAKDVN